VKVEEGFEFLMEGKAGISNAIGQMDVKIETLKFSCSSNYEASLSPEL
jgi:hypothetical protein